MGANERELGMRDRDTNRSTGTAYAWVRSNILGLVAIFLALTGTAVAANVASDSNHARSAKAKKVKRGPAGPGGPAGPAGPAGAQGIQGKQGVAGPGATRLHFLQPETDNATRTIATVGDLTLRANCSDPAGVAAISLSVQSNSSGGILGATLEKTDTGAAPTFPAPTSLLGVPAAPASVGFGGTLTPSALNGILTAFVQGTYNNNADTQVVTFQLVAVANDTGAGNCTLHGTAVRAT
jgi:hypothetical protein